MAIPVRQGICNAQLKPPPLENGELLHVDADRAFAIFQCMSGYTFYSDTAGILWCDPDTNRWPAHQTVCYVDNRTSPDTTTQHAKTGNGLGLDSTTTAICTDCGDDNFLTNTVVAALPGSTTALIVVSVVAGILLLFVAGMCFLINRRRNKRNNLKDDRFLVPGVTSPGKWNRLLAWLSSLPSQPRRSVVSDESESRGEESEIQPGVRRQSGVPGPAETSIYIDSHTTMNTPDQNSWQKEVSDKLKLLQKEKLMRDDPEGTSEPGKLSSHGGKSISSDNLADSAGRLSTIQVPGPAGSIISIDVLPPGIPQPYDIEAPPSLASSYQEIGAVVYPDLDDIQFRKAVMMDVTNGRDNFTHTVPVVTHL